MIFYQEPPGMLFAMYLFRPRGGRAASRRANNAFRDMAMDMRKRKPR